MARKGKTGGGLARWLFRLVALFVLAGLGFADFAKVDIPEDLTALKAWRARVAERPSIAA